MHILVGSAPMAIAAIATLSLLLHIGSALRLEAAQKVGTHKEPLEECSWRTTYREDVCYNLRKPEAFSDICGSARMPRVGIRNLTNLQRIVWYRMRHNPSLRYEFFEAWNWMKNMQGCDVFATKETWQRADTVQLSQWLTGLGFIGPKNITDWKTDPIIKRLPPYKSLYNLMTMKNFALVGTGSGLQDTKLGTEIDDHNHVIRFQRLEGQNLDKETTGLKHTISVVNAKMNAAEGTTLMDMDGSNILRSYCQRLFDGGDFTLKKGVPFFLFTPTGFCKLPKQVTDFSRGFLYWWLIGSLSDDASIYGFMDKRPAYTFNTAKFTEPEQMVFEEVAKQWERNPPAQKAIAFYRDREGNQKTRATVGFRIRS